MTQIYTVRSSPNMAASKYMGKRESTTANLPNNSTVSMTLRGISEPLMTVTSIALSSDLAEDKFYVNGKREENPKGIKHALDVLRSQTEFSGKVIMASLNSYLSDAGIASSSAAAAALASALSEALHLTSPNAPSILAREISGSGARGVFGGWVEWKRGHRPDGKDSYARQLYDENYWSELNDLIVVLYTSPRKVSTDESHRRAVDSPLYSDFTRFSERASKILKTALHQKDFPLLAGTMMSASDAMHGMLASSRPPVRYMNDLSCKLIDFVNEFNASEGEIVVGYTFDAGSNGQVLVGDKHKPAVLRGLNQAGFGRIIEAKAGPEPTLLGAEYSLIDESALTPKSIEPGLYFHELQRKF